ncbi:hypothetical protein ZEAMMB73_Zm00001d049321 [Zea mays]|uniref:Uncharacterized protein n=1 Tax=Zea mays TaxID=4577 RepID=A0A1D6PTS8_MAIZE|nr:hypothetical protein ZEAMMB73_Zm00001d049321 [Zea mays]
MKADDTFQQKSTGPTTFFYIKFFRRNLAFDTRNVALVLPDDHGVPFRQLEMQVLLPQLPEVYKAYVDNNAQEATTFLRDIHVEVVKKRRCPTKKPYSSKIKKCVKKTKDEKKARRQR